MKYVLLPLLLLSFQVDAAVRRLATDCSLPGGAPTELAPFDLDRCTLLDGDEVTQLFQDIAAKWPAGFFVRAPSKTVTLISDYIAFPTSTKYFVFLEDEDPSNRLMIQHKATDPATCVGQACGAFWTMWRFENFDTVKIGGANLSMTFKGNHPGLANCKQHYRPALQIGWNADSARICDINRGLLEFRMTDGTTARLADFRANVRFSQMAAIYTDGNNYEGRTTNKIQQFNVAGLFYATSGVSLHYGVMHAWSDPDRTMFSDPYMRAYGWDGTTSGTDQGQPFGCADDDNNQNRLTTVTGYTLESLKGGFTVEYGWTSWVMRLSGRIGTSTGDPFVIRIKDLGVTGPGTGYAAGVRVRTLGEANFFKGDPADRFSGSGPVRFVRFVKLPDSYASGPASKQQESPPCAKFYSVDAPGNFARFESDVAGRSTLDYWVEFGGDWTSTKQGGAFHRDDIIRFGSSADTSPNYGHTVSAAIGTYIQDTVTLRDRSTVTGPGTWKNLIVADANAMVQGKDSKVTSTNVAGSITVNADTENTIIQNVNFTGPARDIIRINTRANAIVSSICAPVGSTISGTGTLTFNGATRLLPFTVTADLSSQCAFAGVDKPKPPSAVVVN